MNRNLILLIAAFLSLNMNLLGQFGRNVHHFPQLIAGDGSRTSFRVHNPGSEGLAVTLSLFSSDGQPLDTVACHGERAGIEARSFVLNPIGTVNVICDSDGSLTHGWAELSAIGYFAATEFLEIPAEGDSPSRVGVLPSVGAREMRIFAVGGDAKTGFAVHNPSRTVPTTLTFRFRDLDGVAVPCDGNEFGFVDLGPLHQEARFFDELCPNLSGFEGIVEVAASPGEAAILSLIQDASNRISTVETTTATDLMVSDANGLFIGSDQDGDGSGSTVRLGTDGIPIVSLHEDGDVVIQEHSLLLNSVGETALRVQRSGEEGSEFAGKPTFSLGRITVAGDGDPEFRVLYSDDATPERPVLEFDKKGIVASVRTVPGSHFEGFIAGDSEPLFRLNSSPSIQLEFGPGGNAPTDIVMRREEQNEVVALSIQVGGMERVEVRSNGDGVVLQVNGNVTADGFLTSSSRELKENIAEIPAQQALTLLDSLKAVQFSYRDDPGKDLRFGFVAEDVPEPLSAGAGTAVKTTDIVAVLARVVQGQQRTIAALEAEVRNLKQQIK